MQLRLRDIDTDLILFSGTTCYIFLQQNRQKGFLVLLQREDGVVHVAEPGPALSKMYLKAQCVTFTGISWNEIK